MPDLRYVLTNSGDEAVYIKGLVQDLVGAGAEGFKFYSCASRHHHHRRMLAVLKSANERSQLHAVHAMPFVTHQYDVVVLASAQRFVCALSVTTQRDLPVVVSEDRGKKPRYALVGFSNEY